MPHPPTSARSASPRLPIRQSQIFLTTGLQAWLASTVLALLAASVCIAQPTQIANFHPEIPVEDAGFGQSISVSGDLAAVLATFIPPGDAELGVWIYIYARQPSGKWTLEHSRAVTENALGAWAPGGLKLRDERLFVAVQSDAAAVGEGTIRVLERHAGGAFSWGEVDVVQPDVVVGADNFAADLDIEGDLMIVGAPDFAFPRPGTAYIYHRQSSGEWQEIALLRPEDSTANDLFGRFVAISGTTAAVATMGINPRLYFFEQQGEAWPQVARFNLANNTHAFGPDLAMENDVLVSAAPHLGIGGGVTLFNRQPSALGGSWRRGPDILPSEVSPGEAVGAHVALEQGLLVFSAELAGSGAAFVYQQAASDWLRIDRLSTNELSSNAALSASVDTDGAIVALGAPQDASTGTRSGAALLFGESPTVFANGFESGDLAAWSTSLGL